MPHSATNRASTLVTPPAPCTVRLGRWTIYDNDSKTRIVPQRHRDMRSLQCPMRVRFQWRRLGARGAHR